MPVRYLNLDYWFYQIFLLFQAVFDFVINGPEAVSASANSAFLQFAPFALLGLVTAFLYMNEALTLFTLIPIAMLGAILTGLYIFGALNFFTLFPLAFISLLVACMYVYGATNFYVLSTFALLGLLFPLLYLYGIVNIYVLPSFIFFAWLLYSWHKTRQIRKREVEVFKASFVAANDPKTEYATEWQDILEHVDGDIASEWSLALIEADKILEDLLREAGYDGASIGERLKAAEGVGGLKSLQDAWAAHKIRNKIAHESGFVLTKREARIAVESYKKVFEELHFL